MIARIGKEYRRCTDFSSKNIACATHDIDSDSLLHINGIPDRWFTAPCIWHQVLRFPIHLVNIVTIRVPASAAHRPVSWLTSGWSEQRQHIRTAESCDSAGRACNADAFGAPFRGMIRSVTHEENREAWSAKHVSRPAENESCKKSTFQRVGPHDDELDERQDTPHRQRGH
jgi:hypothetical protein